MSSTISADAGVYWPRIPLRAGAEQLPLYPLVPLTVIAQPPSETSSVIVERDWRTRLLQKVQAKMVTTFVGPRGFVNLVTWLSPLPKGLPLPVVVIAGDGSIHLEWVVRGNNLYLSFFDDGTQEAYFEGSNGDEWEASEVIGASKVRDAIDQLLAAA